MHEYRTAVLMILVTLLGGKAFAGTGEVTRFQHLDVDSGLPQNTVRAIVQDQYGYIWIGTEAGGLARHDGTHFLYFDSRTDDDQSLGNMEVSDIIADGDRLWIATVGGGLNELSLRDFSFRHFNTSGPEGQRLSDNYLHRITRTADGGIWMATQKGLNRLDVRTGSIETWFSAADGGDTRDASEVFTAVAADGPQSVLAATVNGLYRVRNGEQALTPLTLDWAGRNKPESIEILDITHGRDGGILLSTSNGLFELLPSAGEENRFAVTRSFLPQGSTERIETALYDRQGRLWVASFGEGVFILDDNFRVLRNIRNRPGGNLSLNDLLVMSLFEDDQGNIWIGTANRGLSILNPRVQAFHHFRHIPGDAGSIANDVIWDFHERADGTLWIATDGGLFHFDEERGVTESFGASEGLTDPFVMNILETSDGTAWATTRKGLFMLEPGGKRFRHFPLHAEEDRFPRKQVTVHLLEDSNGNLWIASMSGVFCVRLADHTQRFYADYLRNGVSERLTWPNDMIETDAGEILYSGTHGLMLLDAQTDRFIDYGEYLGIPAVSGLREILQMEEDADGRLWMATDSGLYVLDRKAGSLQRYDEADGRPDQKFYSLVFDRQGSIWAGSNKGLARFDPQSRRGGGFTTRDGVQSNEFNWNAALLLSDGRIAMGGVGGFNIFDPQEILRPVSPRPTVVTRVTRFSGGQEESRVPDSDSLQLASGETAFSVEYTVLDFSNSHGFSYRYRLAGLEDKWHESTSKNALTYTNLKPGEYLLEIQGFDPATGVDHKPAQLAITVPAAWHQTLLFRGAIALLTVALFAALLLQHAARRRARERLRTEAERRRVFEAMARLARVASRRSSEDLIAGMLMRQLCRILDLDMGLFYLEKNHQLQLMAAYPQEEFSMEVLQDMPDALPRFFNQFMFRHSATALDGDDDQLPDIIARADSRFLVYPLANDQSEHGLLLLRRGSGAFRASDTRIVAGLAKLALAAIDNQRLLAYQQEHRYLDDDALVLSRDHFFKLAESSAGSGNAHFALLTLTNLKHLTAAYDRVIIRRLLRRAAARLANQCRPQDVTGRISETEFAILLNDCTEEVARRIVARIALNVDHLTVATAQGEARLNVTSQLRSLPRGMKLVDVLAELRQERNETPVSSLPH